MQNVPDFSINLLWQAVATRGWFWSLRRSGWVQPAGLCCLTVVSTGIYFRKDKTFRQEKMGSTFPSCTDRQTLVHLLSWACHSGSWSPDDRLTVTPSGSLGTEDILTELWASYRRISASQGRTALVRHFKVHENHKMFSQSHECLLSGWREWQGTNYRFLQASLDHTVSL